MGLDFNFSSCKILFVFCIVIIIALIITIIVIIYKNNNKVFILEDNSPALIKKNPITYVINMDEPKSKENNNINPFDEQILNLHKPTLEVGNNMINKQELEEHTVSEYEVEKVKAYVPLKSQKRIKLSNIKCNLNEDINCGDL